MPHPSHRIDVLIVPTDPGCRIQDSTFDGLLAGWRKDDLVRGDRPGGKVDGLTIGGFARIWLDQPTRMVLYANQQGGFRVRCPVDDQSIAGAYGRALKAWRGGAARELVCPSCTQTHALDDCVLVPTGAFGSSAIVLSDVGTIELTERVHADLQAAIGPFRVVMRRSL